MKRNDGVKSKEMRSDPTIFKNYSFKTPQQKVNFEHHFIVPWERVEEDDLLKILKEKNNLPNNWL